jgi:phage terminase large subunit
MRSKDPLIRIVEMNWRDNPRFPEKLERERQRDLKERPEQYDHVWEGKHVSIIEGAYYAQSLAAARLAGRVGRVSEDPLLTHRVFCDIGGTGARADAFTMWDQQFVGREIRCLNYYEAVGQPLAAHLAWLREKGLTPQRAQIWLPHDGEQGDKVYAVTYESAFKAAGYSVTVVPNQGRGAAKARIEAGRRHFAAYWFNEETCQAGLDALGWYHEKKDEARGIGLGPEHDWSSHGADSFGMSAVSAERIWNESGKGIEDFNQAFRRRA